MKYALRIFSTALLLSLISGLSSLSFAAGPNQPELLPKEARRKVIGTWQLSDSNCTRSIEQIEERLYVVARCRQPANADGSIGIPLTRIANNLFRNLSGVDYEIQSDGYLLVKIKDEVFDRGARQKQISPQ